MAPIQLYTLPSNHSSRRARAFLKEHDIPHVHRSLMSEQLSFEGLKHILSMTEGGIADILAGSVIVKRLASKGVYIDDLTLSQFHALYLEHPTLLKAPILITKYKIIIGFNQEEYETLIPRHIRRRAFKHILSGHNGKDDAE